MGGRRAGSLTSLVGSGGAVTPAKSRLTRAIKGQDPSEIATASVQLVLNSELGLGSIRLALKLVPYLQQNASELAQLSRPERDERIREAWSDVKRQANVVTSKEVDGAIIGAANAAFAKRGRNR